MPSTNNDMKDCDGLPSRGRERHFWKIVNKKINLKRLYPCEYLEFHGDNIAWI